MNNLDNEGPFAAFFPELLETILGYDNRDQPEAALVRRDWYQVSLSLSAKAASAKIIGFANFFLAQIKQPSQDVIARVEQIKQNAARSTPRNFKEVKQQTASMIERFLDIARTFPQGPLQTHLLRQVIRPLAELGHIESALNIALIPGNPVNHLVFTQDVLDVLIEQGKIEEAQKIAEVQSDALLKFSLLSHCIRKITALGLFAAAETVIETLPPDNTVRTQSAQMWSGAFRFKIFQLINHNQTQQAIQLACSIANGLSKKSALDSIAGQLIRQARLDEAFTVIDFMSPADTKEHLETLAKLFVERGEQDKAQLALSKKVL